MRTLEDYEQARHDNRRARLFTYFAKTLAASPDLHERRALFDAMVPANYKAAVPAAVFDPLAPASSYGSREFLALSERQRIVPRLLGSVPMIPFAPTPVASTVGHASFTPEGAPLPAFRFDVDQVFASPARIGMLCVITKELARSTNERAVSTVERLLSRVLTRGENTQFLSTDARVPGTNPGGILHDLAPISGSPSVSADDVSALFDAVSDGQPERPYFILSSRGALHLRTEAESNAGSIFSDVDAVAGGTVAGIPVLIAPEAGANMILIDAAMLGTADEGLDVAGSESGAIQQDDAPVPGATAQVSMFQTNSVALRLLRHVDWVLATEDAVAYIELPISGSPA